MIYNLFYFKLQYIEDGKTQIYEPQYKDKHRNPLELLDDDDIDMVEIKCPKCGKIMNDDSDESMFSVSSIVMTFGIK